MPGSADPRILLDGPVLEVAPRLLGAVLRSETPYGVVAVQLTEVEAYDGVDDPGSHAHRGRTVRNDVMFGPAGVLYTYFIYGMHVCANIVTGPPGRASAVLLRAGRVTEGVELARARRGTAATERDLCRGPARLCRALDISLAENGARLEAPHPSPLRAGGEEGVGEEIGEGRGDRPRLTLELPAPTLPVASIATGPRVGLRRAGDRPWRFWVAGDPTVSAYRPAKAL